MALCDSSVLTGQEGSISFKPPGTSVCVRDYTPFGQDDSVATHIVLECGADFRVGDVVVFTEEDGGKLDSALSPGTPRSATSAIGGITALGGFVGGSLYTEGSYTGVALTNGTGTGATANIVVDSSGEVSAVTLVSGGQGYLSTDQLSAAAADLGGTGSGLVIEVETVYQPAASGMAYYVVGSGKTIDGEEWIEVGLAPGGAAIAMNGDGGTGSADSDLPAHINIRLADWFSVCGVREFSLDITRDELDVTTLPCSDGGDDGCARLAAFRSTQAGYASATGTMSVYFTCDQENIANRLLGSSLLKSQSGATVRLYVCTKFENNEIDNDASLYVEAEISITGMSFSVNPDDPTVGELTFSVTKMVSAFGLVA